jgi:hypothetical protein
MNELRSIDETPPATPVAGPLVMPLGMDQQNATNSSDSRKLSGRKKVRRDRSAAYREIQRLKVALAKAQRRSQKYKKQAQRAKAGVSSSIKDTPRSKTRSMLSQSIVNPVVKKSLFLHNVLCNSIRERYHTTKSDKVRQLLASIVASNLLRKYKLMRTCRKSTGISERRLSSSAKYKVATYSYVREPCKSKTYRLRNLICQFLERDDNSRITTSKSDTITRHGNKKQRRLLTDTMTRLCIPALPT